MSETFRVYVTSDMLGMELGGSLKNVIALAAGIADGLGYGDNTKAALITRGIREIAQLGVARGGHPDTFNGITGVGDLIVTCTSVHSRNWRAGHMLGKGNSLKEVLESMGMVVEGIATTKAAYELAQQKGIEMPITAAIYEVLYNEANVEDIIVSLMKRDGKSEA